MTPSALEAIHGARIAHLIETDMPGGAERMLASLAGALHASGCPGVAFLPRDRHGWLSHELSSVGIPVEYFVLERPFSPKLARELAAAFVRYRIDLAHSHEFEMAVYGAWSARKAGIPHVITMHGGRVYAQRWRRRIALRLAVESTGGAVAVSLKLGEHLRRDLLLSPRLITVIPNGVAPARAIAPTLRNELHIAPEEKLVVSVGSLYPVKGHRFLIEALALLGATQPEIHLAIAGRGELADALAEQARALGLDRRVHLLGLRSDIPMLLAAADLFVLPSLSEGLPLALLEAMFAARPIVATNVGDVQAALGSEAGVVVPPGDPRSLASAIARLLADRATARSMGGRAAVRAAEEYGLDRMVDRYARVYEGRLKRHSP